MQTSFHRECEIRRTARVLQLEGIFDIPPTSTITHKWDVNLPIEDKEWNIGLIVGPSGCGKSSIVEELFPDSVHSGFDWEDNSAIVDCFPSSMSVKQISSLLNSVGFSSPPSWLKPFRVLSNGEKFRVSVARAIAESPDFCVIDEFTSVVDRTVAKIGSAAISKAVRKAGTKFVAVTCHDDVEEWLQPDWVYIPTKEELKWRRLRRRPEIHLNFFRVHRSAWGIFKQHHYLNTKIHHGCRSFMATWNGRPVAFIAILPFPHPKLKGVWRGHRVVCLPDYQGIGIGLRIVEFIGEMCKGLGLRFRFTASHPVLKSNSDSSEKWRIYAAPKIGSRSIGKVLTPKKDKKARQDSILTRRVVSVEYIGPAMGSLEAESLWNSFPVMV